MHLIKHSFLALVSCAALAVPAAANPANVARVTEGLIAAGMAIELAERCDTVRVRMVRGLNFLQGLKNHLSSLGYSNADIEAFIDDDAEKDRLEGIARQRLVDLGATPGNAASHCSVARAQIAQGTVVGQLLR